MPKLHQKDTKFHCGKHMEPYSHTQNKELLYRCNVCGFKEIELQCTVLVEGITDPASHNDLFLVNLTPKDMMLPEGFCIMNSISEVAYLEQYLSEGVDDYSWEQNYHGEEEEDEFLATLPAPLNNVDAEFTLKWNLKDVALDKAAYVFCKVYHTYHTLEMLEAKSVGELRIIAIVVGAHLADKKPKLIHNILVKQSEGAWSIYGIKGEP
jgi:hypothetical protein